MTARHGAADPGPVIRVGRIAAVHGVRGWLKIESGTDPAANILGYRPWWLRIDDHWTAVDADGGEVRGKRVLAHLAGVDDRDLARRYCQLDIHVEARLLPALPEGEYYWHQLIGLRVIGRTGSVPESLGTVASLLETGVHDVLVVRDAGSEAVGQERLIPYTAVLGVDLEAGVIEVDWAADY